jgi:hypothetical protein
MLQQVVLLLWQTAVDILVAHMSQLSHSECC